MSRSYVVDGKISLERVLLNVDVGLCWEWTGYVANGYGRINVKGHLYVHRVVWELLVGPIPEGMELDHLCRNRRCCNPDHLEPVTHAINARRGIAGAYLGKQTHCIRGHEWNEKNIRVTRSGRNYCRPCIIARKSERSAA